MNSEYEISIDTETTGFDLHHSARPFIVVSGRLGDGVTIWEWDVDPLTRMPVIPEADVQEVLDLIYPRGVKPNLVLHNSKFDVAALKTIFPKDYVWPWHRTNDTLIASHVLDTNKLKNLTDFTTRMIGRDIQPWEKRVKEACQAARRYARSKYKDWVIAKEGIEDMPSIKEESWKADMWLPRALWKVDDTIRNRNPSWETVTAEYAETDATATAAIWPVARKMIKDRDLWEQYQGKLKCMELAHRMETRGTTINIKTLQSQRGDYAEQSLELEGRLRGIARTYGYELELGKAMNKSLNAFLFTDEGMNLPVVKTTDKGSPSFDKIAVEMYLHTLPEGKKQRRFVELIANKKKCDTAIGYMDAYEKFAIPDKVHKDYVLIHPSMNPVGTNVTRWTSNNPNEQSIGKQKGFNVRKPFGPAPGREWWPLDYSNLELRIPVYDCKEPFLLDLFERPDDPPFFGSNHLVNFSIVFPDLWEDAMKRFGPKDAGEWIKSDAGYKSTQYKWCKNGWFAIQYGAMLQENGWGTADIAFHKQGAHAQLFSRLNKLSELSASQIRFANKHGYIETIPVKGRKRGFPVSVQRMSHGGVLPTTPLSYRVQGTAGEIMDRAMIRCQAKLDDWYKETGFDGFITMMIHDEIVFDFPKSKVHPKEIKEGDSMFRKMMSNLWRVRILQYLMAKSGEDLVINIPTPAAAAYCEKSWGDELAI